MGLRNRQQQVASVTIARSLAAQQRLCGKHRELAARKDSKSVVNAAVARELAEFVWVEMVATDRTTSGSPGPVLDRVGVHYQTIGYLERGEYSPTLALAFRIAAVFELPLTEVFSDRPFPSLREVLTHGADPSSPKDAS